LDKAGCVKIPENAYAVSGSNKDVWACKDGYREVDNLCMAEGKEIKDSATNIPLTPNPDEDFAKTKKETKTISEVTKMFIGQLFAILKNWLLK